jgi:hypothetical protein
MVGSIHNRIPLVYVMSQTNFKEIIYLLSSQQHATGSYPEPEILLANHLFNRVQITSHWFLIYPIPNSTPLVIVSPIKVERTIPLRQSLQNSKGSYPETSF